MRVRTQVLLSQGQYSFLKDEAARTGLPLSELVRRAVDHTYRPEERLRVRGFDVSFGFWRDPDAAVVGRRGGRR
jgi:hypothetical protein